MMDRRGAKPQPLRVEKREQEGRGLGWALRRAACTSLGRGCRVRSGGARSEARRCGHGMFPRLALGLTAQPRLARLAPPSRRPLPVFGRLSVLSVAGLASRRLPAGCQASMIGPASDAFLPPPTRCPCGSPGSHPPLHSSSAHTRFPRRIRSLGALVRPARERGSEPAGVGVLRREMQRRQDWGPNHSHQQLWALNPFSLPNCGYPWGTEHFCTCQVPCAVHRLVEFLQLQACNIIPIFSDPKASVSKSALKPRLSEAKDHVLRLYSENVLK